MTTRPMLTSAASVLRRSNEKMPGAALFCVLAGGNEDREQRGKS
jgi:hypothetical protein